MKTRKALIVTGDRVLIEPGENAEKSSAGLYLPPTVREKEKLHGGKVVGKGPGHPIADTSGMGEPWQQGKPALRYVPLEVQEGDYALYLKSEAVEIEFEGKKFVIVPHSSILAIVRTDIIEDNIS